MKHFTRSHLRSGGFLHNNLKVFVGYSRLQAKQVVEPCVRQVFLSFTKHSLAHCAIYFVYFAKPGRTTPCEASVIGISSYTLVIQGGFSKFALSGFDIHNYRRLILLDVSALLTSLANRFRS
jgi:hypothetical protein